MNRNHGQQGGQIMKKSNLLIAITIFALICTGIATPAAARGAIGFAPAPEAKLARDLAETIRSGGEMRVIVTHTPDFAGRDIAGLSAQGSRVLRTFPRGGAFAATMTSSEILDLASDPRILSVSPDRKVQSAMDMGVPAVGADRKRDGHGRSGGGRRPDRRAHRVDRPGRYRGSDRLGSYAQ